MSWIAVVLLSILQGVTEFLPVSSSGHLFILGKILNVPGDMLFFNVMLHFASGLAILIVLRKEVLEMFRSKKIFLLVLVSTIPVVIVGLLVKDYVDLLDKYFFVIGIGLLLTSLFNYLIDKFENKENYKKMNWQNALVIGLFQILALVPGVSRSGSTIVGASYVKLEKESALRYSFLLALPAIFGASTLEIFDVIKTGDMGGVNMTQVLVGVVICFIVSFYTIKWFLHKIKKMSFAYFSVYTLILGLVIIYLSL